MVIKILAFLFYILFVLFAGEIIVIKYSRSTMQMHMNNSLKRNNPEAFVLFNLILLIFAHVAMIALNCTVWYLSIKYLF